MGNVHALIYQELLEAGEAGYMIRNLYSLLG